MLINFLGSPCSGKTTTASRVYAYLKEAGIAVEFIPEQARLYIAQKRKSLNLKPGDKLQLTSQDQSAIMFAQLSIQALFIETCDPDVVLLTDSSPLNSLMYLTEEERSDPNNLDFPHLSRLALLQIQTATKLYRCEPILRNTGHDALRVHNAEESAKAEAELDIVIQELGLSASFLFGRPEERSRVVETDILTSILTGS